MRPREIRFDVAAILGGESGDHRGRLLTGETRAPRRWIRLSPTAPRPTFSSDPPRRARRTGWTRRPRRATAARSASRAPAHRPPLDPSTLAVHLGSAAAAAWGAGELAVELSATFRAGGATDLRPGRQQHLGGLRGGARGAGGRHGAGLRVGHGGHRGRPGDGADRGLGGGRGGCLQRDPPLPWPMPPSGAVWRSRSADVADTAATLAMCEEVSSAPNRRAAGGMLWLESPTNPLLAIADLPALIEGGHRLRVDGGGGQHLRLTSAAVAPGDGRRCGGAQRDQAHLGPFRRGARRRGHPIRGTARAARGPGVRCTVPFPVPWRRSWPFEACGPWRCDSSGPRPARRPGRAPDGPIRCGAACGIPVWPTTRATNWPPARCGDSAPCWRSR